MTGEQAMAACALSGIQFVTLRHYYTYYEAMLDGQPVCSLIVPPTRIGLMRRSDMHLNFEWTDRPACERPVSTRILRQALWTYAKRADRYWSPTIYWGLVR